MSQISENKKRIDECRDMESYHTACSLKAMNEGDKEKEKAIVRKQQANKTELQE